MIFDCLEFSPAYRCGDVAAEIAFLVMDLAHAGRADLGWWFADAYVRATGDAELWQLLDFYACTGRSCAARSPASRLPQTTAPEARERITTEAQEYFDLATAYAGGLSPPDPHRHVWSSGNGEEHPGDISRRAAGHGAPRDRRHSQGHGGAAADRAAERTPDRFALLAGNDATTYASNQAKGPHVARPGMSVILDGTYNDPRERALARDLAGEPGPASSW